MKLKVNKGDLVVRVNNALAEEQAAANRYLEAYGRLIELDETLKTKKAEATLSVEGKTASIRQAKATLAVARELVERAKAKVALERADIDRDTARLYYRVLSAILSAAGGEALLYPIEDKIPDPLKQVEEAYTALRRADEELARALEHYIIKDTELELKKAQKIALGIEGKNEEERKAKLLTDPEIRALREEVTQAKLEYEAASVNRQIARDRLRFWLTYMRSLGLDEALVDDPGRIERR